MVPSKLIGIRGILVIAAKTLGIAIIAGFAFGYLGFLLGVLQSPFWWTVLFIPVTTAAATVELRKRFRAPLQSVLGYFHCMFCVSPFISCLPFRHLRYSLARSSTAVKYRSLLSTRRQAEQQKLRSYPAI